MKKHLASMIYCSTASKALTDDANLLSDLLEKANVRNEKLGITGAMAVADGYVLQCLEGDRKLVWDLYTEIAADPRHENCLLLDFRSIDRRLYAEWGMAAVPAALILGRESGRYPTGNFDPYELDSDDAFQFMVSASEPELLAS